MNKGHAPGKWEERRGYRGEISHTYEDNLHVVVREDFLATKLRFRVLIYVRRRKSSK
jgi:hypothetical protein